MFYLLICWLWRNLLALQGKGHRSWFWRRSEHTTGRSVDKLLIIALLFSAFQCSLYHQFKHIISSNISVYSVCVCLLVCLCVYHWPRQDKYRNDLTLVEAENLALDILKQVMEDKVSNLNVELATVTAAGYHTFDYAELDTVIARIA